MTRLKLTSWNIEWLDKLVEDHAAGARRQRWNAILEEIHEINPDLLCVVEGPKGVAQLQTFAAALGDGYVPVLHRDANGAPAPDTTYKTQGRQWVWFFARADLAPAPARAELLDPAAWFEFTQGARWDVHYWGDFEKERHRHYRTPQVLIVEWDLPGRTRLRVDFVGLHLKSKLVKRSVSAADWASDPANDKKRAYIQEATKARIKLATEALDVRRYIDARFQQESQPAIFLLGDLNDGPGKELFEREFLFFDLVSNLQGDVFFSTRFLNHALFDFAEELRWSVQFKDPLDPARDPRILLDHIMFTQGLTQKRLPMTVEPHAGLIEHTIHEAINAPLPKAARTSDHRPVSCLLTLNLPT